VKCICRMEQMKFNPVYFRPLLKSRPRASARMGQLCNHLTHPQFHKYLDVCDVQDEHSRGQHGCDPDKSRVSSFIHCKFFLTSKINSGTVRMRTVSVATDDLTCQILLKFRRPSSRAEFSGLIQKEPRNQVARCYPRGIRDPTDCGVRTARWRQV